MLANTVNFFSVGTLDVKRNGWQSCAVSIKVRVDEKIWAITVCPVVFDSRFADLSKRLLALNGLEIPVVDGCQSTRSV